jgi:hypothetical protein
VLLVSYGAIDLLLRAIRNPRSRACCRCGRSRCSRSPITAPPIPGSPTNCRCCARAWR